jgi:dihydroflavonol-4-reductase
VGEDGKVLQQAHRVSSIPSMSTVLVTGGSGFIASHCILQLIAAGYQVRTTVRNQSRKVDVPSVVADLENDAGWTEAVAGCDYVLHVASPFPHTMPTDENDLIVPAREGALRVLRAARNGGVKRVVLTSSFAAIGYGHREQRAAFDETNWSNVKAPGVTAYAKSKYFAERAAWDFIAKEGGALELSVVNPVGVFGPLLGPDLATSILMVKRMMDGAIPGVPHLYFGVVDVRDIADLHVRAMTHPAAKGERFLGTAGDFLSMLDMARALKRRLGAAAKRVPARQLPNWLVRLVALRDPAARYVLPELGKYKNGTGAKARRLLGWTPRPSEDALVATAESLLQLGLVKGHRVAA